jgi:hypothetical protein
MYAQKRDYTNLLLTLAGFYFVAQYVVVKPILSLTTLVLWQHGKFDPVSIALDQASIYIQILSMVSLMMALYGLVALYRATHHQLKKYRVAFKFIIIKLLLLFSTFQITILRNLVKFDVIKDAYPFSAELRSELWNCMLILIEVSIMSVLLRFAYPLSDNFNVNNTDEVTQYGPDYTIIN